jgi:hypothetical protein
MYGKRIHSFIFFFQNFKSKLIFFSLKVRKIYKVSRLTNIFSKSHGTSYSFLFLFINFFF